MSNKFCIFYSNLKLPSFFWWTTETKVELCFLSLVWEIGSLKQILQDSPEEHGLTLTVTLKHCILCTCLVFRGQILVSSGLVWKLLVHSHLRGFLLYSTTQRRLDPFYEREADCLYLLGQVSQWEPCLVHVVTPHGTFWVKFPVATFLFIGL